MSILQTKVTNPVYQGEYAFVIQPNDSTNISSDSNNTKQKEKVSIYVGVGGNVKVNTADGQTVTFTGIASGSFVPVLVTRVWNSGTTATTMLGIA